MLIQFSLNHLRSQVINPAIKDFGTITSLTYKDKKLLCSFKLLGLEDQELSASCSSIRIFDNENAIQLGDFNASKPFLKNILTKFCSKKFYLPQNFLTKSILKVLKVII